MACCYHPLFFYSFHFICTYLFLLCSLHWLLLWDLCICAVQDTSQPSLLHSPIRSALPSPAFLRLSNLPAHLWTFCSNQRRADKNLAQQAQLLAAGASRLPSFCCVFWSCSVFVVLWGSCIHGPTCAEPDFVWLFSSLSKYFCFFCEFYFCVIWLASSRNLIPLRSNLFFVEKTTFWCNFLWILHIVSFNNCQV